MEYAIVISDVQRVYKGSDGRATKAMYDELEKRGPAGIIAVNLFRAQKTSKRAKVYRGGNGHGSYRQQSYERKDWSIGNLCRALTAHAEPLGIVWGWGYDAKAVNFEHVLYVNLPTGQCSFHQHARGDGPDFSGAWDNKEDSASRIMRWCARLLAAKPQPVSRCRPRPESQEG